jgi:hypothetical protein
MQEHRGSAAAAAAADLSPNLSPADAAVATRAVQAGVALTLFEMAAWRLDEALADVRARARLAAALEMELTSRALAAAASHLRWLVCLLGGSEPPPAGVAQAPAAACVDLLVLLGEWIRPEASASPLGGGGWVLLRALANAVGLQSSVADLAALHGVAPARVLAALEELAAAGCAMVDRSPEDGSATARLTSEGVRLAEADPFGAAVRCAQVALDEESLWRLVQLGGALLQIDTPYDAAAKRAPPAHGRRPSGAARKRSS